MLWYTPFVRCAVAHGAPFASVSRCAVVNDNDVAVHVSAGGDGRGCLYILLWDVE